MNYNEKIMDYLKSFQKDITINLYGPLLERFPSVQENSAHLFIDGGTKLQDKVSHSLSVGDGDSYNGELDIKLPSEKDISDLGYCLKHLHDFSLIKLYGFIGGRLDHQMAVFGEVYHSLKKSNDQVCFIDHQVLATNQKQVKLNLQGTFSLFSFEQLQLSITGKAKYQVSQEIISPFSSKTLSNIGNGQIEIISNEPIFIFYEYNSNKSHDRLLLLNKE